MSDNKIEIVGPKIKLFLEPEHYKNERKVGELHGDVLVVDKKKAKYVFEKFHSYGFPLEMIKRVKFKILRVKCLGGVTLETTKSYLLKFGKRNTENDLEEQIHLAIEDFGLHKALQWENDEAKKPKSFGVFDAIREMKERGEC